MHVRGDVFSQTLPRGVSRGARWLGVAPRIQTLRGAEVVTFKWIAHGQEVDGHMAVLPPTVSTEEQAFASTSRKMPAKFRCFI